MLTDYWKTASADFSRVSSIVYKERRKRGRAVNRRILYYLKIDKVFIPIIFSKLAKGLIISSTFLLSISVCPPVLGGYAVGGAIFVSRLVSKVFQNLLKNRKSLSEIIFCGSSWFLWTWSLNILTTSSTSISLHIGISQIILESRSATLRNSLLLLLIFGSGTMKSTEISVHVFLMDLGV